MSKLPHHVTEKSKLLGLRFRRARLSLNWKIETAAEAAGVSESTIKKIEKGSTSVSFGAYLSLMNVFGNISELDSMMVPSRDLISAPPFSKQRASKTSSGDDIDDLFSEMEHL